MRIGPRHPRLGAALFNITRPLFERYYTKLGFYHPTSDIASSKIQLIREKIQRGERAYIGGISVGGNHNSGVALVEVSKSSGAKIFFNNEQERFSGTKHCTEYPRRSIDNLLRAMKRVGLQGKNIDAWVSTWDYALLAATWVRIAF